MIDRNSDDLARPASYPDDEYQPVELKTSLAPGSPPTLSDLLGMSATAYLLDADGNRITGSLVTVWTAIGDPRQATGADDATGGARGAIGVARYNPRRGALEIASLPIASGDVLLFGKTTGAVTTSTGTFTVNNITAAGRCAPPTSSSTDTIIVANWCGWSCSASGITVMFCLADLTAASGSIGHGNFVQGPCPP